MAAGSVEIAISNGGWNGDFALTANGDLQLAIDTPATPAATVQRLVRAIQTTPRLTDAAGNPIARPDDCFNCTYGSGVRALVNQPITPALIAGLQARIIAALLADPSIAPNPPPVVNVGQTGTFTVSISVTCFAVSGEIVTIPSLTLPYGS
jgi:hypothetical protein